ncbi:hypothetical protein MSG28_002096 [Choristoneura fumiferana]|uniref:Uncharacterized protein n=1 Tax=Choristoneura fumiferana TaxID=7141 RepID=A0ACC0JU85_CHOFU|nr:hypothetical protein MSG28_002096 [Choristoneura fumiferana]
MFGVPGRALQVAWLLLATTQLVTGGIACLGNPCLHGICIDDVNRMFNYRFDILTISTYSCYCVDGYTGVQCQTNWDECWSSPCLNGGTCLDGIASYNCSCPDGFIGDNCETNYNECESNPCLNNGTCIDMDNGYICSCVPGFAGEHCELDVAVCNSTEEARCYNGGHCIEGPGFKFYCKCLAGWAGPKCEQQIDECESNPCQNGGVCIDVHADYMCACTYGFTGKSCEVQIEFCDENSCSNNALCVIEDGFRVCYCVPDYHGERCELQYDECLLGPRCMNGGTCIDGVDNFTCSCPPRLTGSLCECLIQDDDTYDCEYISPTPIPDSTLMITADMFTDTTTDFIPTTNYVEYNVTSVTFPVEITSVDNEKTSLSFDITTLASEEATFETVYETTETEMYATAATEIKETSEPSDLITETTTAGNFVDGGVSATEVSIIATSDVTTAKEITDLATLPEATTSSVTEIISDATTTPKMDTTTGRMFTDTPTDHPITELVTPSDISTTEVVELTTILDNTTFEYTTDQSECSELDLFPPEQHCNATLRLNDTVAMSGGQVARISTLNNDTMLYFGNMPNVNDTENMPFIGCIWDLMVNDEKLEVFGGAVDASEVTECASLACLSGPCLNGGTCSDQGGSYTCSCTNGWIGEHCNTSVCSHNPCHSGGSCVKHPGSGFLCLCPFGKHGIFCEYNVEITRPSLAPISSEISSYIIYPLSQMGSGDRFDLRLRFQTTDMDQIALLAFVGQSGRHDSHSHHLALTFVKGYVMLTWNMGGGPRRVFTARALGGRRGGHAVRAWRRGRSAGLSVDGRHNVSGNAPAHDTKMTVMPYVYIGGHPSPGFRDLPHDLPLHSGWRGCVWEVSGQAIGSGKAVGGRGVGQCGVAQCAAKSCNAPRGVCIHSPATYGCICSEGWFGATCASPRGPCDAALTRCRGKCLVTGDRAQCDCPYGKTGPDCDTDLVPTDVLFLGTRSFARLRPQPVTSVSLSLEAEIKPEKERGLIAFLDTPHFYTTLSLQGGVLEYRWTDRLSGVTSLVRSGVVVSLGQWHSVKAGRYGSRLYVWADGALSTEAMLAHAYPHTHSTAAVLLGGAEDLSTLPFDVMSGPPEPFTGCIRNLHINNILLPLEPENIVEGQNLEDCDGTACGAEACGGASCLVERGRARCRCTGGAGGAGGARCRRHAACAPARCRAPAGRCRRDRCVCAAAHAGEDCQLKVNVTIPQFSGDSLLALGRRTAQPASQQRLGTAAAAPDYVALNFTTAEPMGLLLSVIMGSKFLGIGIENGYLKVAWSIPDETTQTVTEKQWKLPKPTPVQSKLVPRAGFLADGEWHTMILRLEKTNLSITVDQNLVAAEEPGWTDSDYDEVDLFIGGINEEDSAVTKRVFPYNFKGCIDHIATKEDSYFTSFNEVYSENVKSCQLFPSASA